MKVFLSIGTGPGIGFATAERFARAGFRIILSARSEEKTQALARRLRAEESPEKVKGTMKCDLLVALTNQKRPHRAFKDSVPEILFLVFTRDSFFPH
ncbi:SDR family NAD(P)-dependent oxidoreductase [Citrobacter freundii]|nr:SDR family NAD(P)-dependent oxidoreductase [Citrobacter freundii]